MKIYHSPLQPNKPRQQSWWLFGTVLLMSVLSMRAVSFIEWQQQQDIEVSSAGLVTLSLPAETLNAVRPQLQDLRLVDAQGNETPYFIDRATPARQTIHPAKSFRSSLQTQTTILLIETGLTLPVTSVLLQTPARQFIKAVRVEGSRDGQHWQEIANGVPIFQQPSASGLEVAFAMGEWPWLRLTLDDRRSDPLPFTGASLRAAAQATFPTEPVTVSITTRDEDQDESRLTLDLGAANLALASIDIETDDPLFTRNVTLATTQLHGDDVREQTLASGTILRFGGNGEPEVEQRTVVIERQIPSHELVLRIRNEDSPPLAITTIRARRRPVNLMFFAREAGRYRLFVGNSLCNQPHYDIAALSSQLRTQGAQTVETVVGSLSNNPSYESPEALPGISRVGAALDVSSWRHRKPIHIEQAGVQRVELDLEVLSRAQRSLSDLRLMREGRQMPFLIEHTSITRWIEPNVTQAEDPEKPSISRWVLKLSQENLPVTRLVCTSPTLLFERRVRLFEEIIDDRGTRRSRELGSASWSQAPDRNARRLELKLTQSPITDRLLLETDNGDNLPVQLGVLQLCHPVTRLVFKANAGDAPVLYYGNRKVNAPDYDLKLVGRQLLAVPKATATLGVQDDFKTSSWTEAPPLSGMRGLLFWGVLGLVVVALLIIIARLLPKSKASTSE